jgi:hypothetical protein
MSLKKIYPNCFKDFSHWILTKPVYYNFYQNLGEPKPFDVTLRDGLQALTKDAQINYTTSKKMEIYKHLMLNQKLKNIEIGSIVSEKVLPIFKDTEKLFEVISCYMSLNEINNYVVIANKEKLKKVINNPNINHFSFITSVSNSFQLKNTKMNLEQSESEIYEMLYQIDDNNIRIFKPTIKLYISCINECPLEGKIDNDFIVNRILKLSKMNIDNICLSDTCGSLTLEDFEYIVETCIFFGLQPSRLSLHLHVQKEKEKEVEQIIHKALDLKIINFDVSDLKTGGCSVTMPNSMITPNLSYELYYKFLITYIVKKCDI